MVQRRDVESASNPACQNLHGLEDVITWGAAATA